jgi:hypothetical protein
MNALLEELREQMARPVHGRPNRYEILFNDKIHGDPETARQWWWKEVVPVVRNITGERASITKRYSAYVDTYQEAEAVSLFFWQYLVGVLDWQEIEWVLIK